MTRRTVPALAALLLLVLPAGAASQAGPPEGPAPTVPGTAVLHRGPLQIDTIPILCQDREHPELGFVTEVDNAEWTPEVTLTLWPTPGAADSVSIRFDDGVSTYDRTFTSYPSNGMYLAGVNIVSWDPGPGVDLQFGADCSERLTREGGEDTR
jgi:hypothetical protein